MTRGVRIPLLVFIVSIIALEFPGARDLVRMPYSGVETLNLIVQNIDPTSPNVGGDIGRDDEIVQIDGVRVRNRNHLRAIVGANRRMEPQTYTLQREGALLQTTVRYIPVPTSIVYRRFPHLLVAFTFLLVGILVLIRRNDAVGKLFALNCALLAFFLTDRPIAWAPASQLVAELVDDAAILLFPAVFLHFFLVFHDRPRGMSRRERIRRYVWIYSLPAAIYLLGSFVAVLRFLGGGEHASLVQIILVGSTAYYTVYLVASLVIFVRNYRSSSVGQRQKLRIAILGTVVGIVPFLGMIVWRQISTAPHDALEFLSVLALGFVSVSFAYAILKHGAIEVNIVVRKSLVYGLFSGVIIAGYYTIVNLVGDYVTRELKLQPMYLSFATVALLALIFAPARDLVQRVTDRLFFRGDYDYKHEVVEFNRRLSTTLRRDAIFDLFFSKIESLLHPSYIAFYTRASKEDEWVMVRSAGVVANSGKGDGGNGSSGGTTLPTVFPRASMLVRYLVRYRRPLMVEFLDYSWGKRNLDEASTKFLHESRAAVCVPVCGPDSLMGLVALGPKRSGQLYNQTDSKLIERFVSHLALVLDNAELHEATIQQERLKNELLLARDIQLGLLPTEPPKHPSIEILGKMVSSAEVGGDYFDYFMLDGHRIGVAVGDVSGKGVPAAMLMSSVQAVFKKLALRDKLGPADVVAELNEHLCSSATKADQFATFFYGIIDTRTSTVTFSNAGHCPPLLCKRGYADRLAEGGLPLGVDNSHKHNQGTVRLDSGDLLCLYTDGIVEQSGGDDLFGEERLMRFLEAHRNLPICELPELLFAAVQDFGAGHQGDDTTCVIAQYKTG